MLMVVILHFNNNGANTGIVNMPAELTNRLTWGFLVEILCIVAVNCFVLVSGYFGIKLRVRSMLKFYLQCLVIGVVSYVAYVALAGESVWSWQVMAERLLAFTHNGWWFVVSYVGLMLLSPLLNKAVEHMTKKELLLSVVLYGVVILYLGWYQKVEWTNAGSSLISLAWIYIIGRYVGAHARGEHIRRYRWWWLAGYLLASLALFGVVMLRYHCGWAVRYPLDYNNPFVVIAAVMLLLFFLSWRFESKVVNWLAGGVFAAYLLQESKYWGHDWLYPQMRALFEYVPDGWRILALLGVSVAFVLGSVLVDKVLGLAVNGVLAAYDRCQAGRCKKIQE